MLLPTPAAGRPSLGADWPRGLVVATDGRAASELALVAARRFAGSAPFGILSVEPAINSVERGSSPGAPPLSTDAYRQLIEQQLIRVLGDAVVDSLEMRSGYPPAVLAAYADTHRTPLLIVGIGRPRVLDRLLGDESTLRLARVMRTPLLAVAPGRAVPPRCVVVALDFSDTSLRAAHLALSVAAPDAEVLLAHVVAPAERRAPDGAMRRHVEALQTGFCGRVVPVQLRGDPATEVLAFAIQRSPDLVALGAHGQHPMLPALTVRLASSVARNTSVLVAPWPAEPGEFRRRTVSNKRRRHAGPGSTTKEVLSVWPTSSTPGFHVLTAEGGRRRDRHCALPGIVASTCTAPTRRRGGHRESLTCHPAHDQRRLRDARPASRRGMPHVFETVRRWIRGVTATFSRPRTRQALAPVVRLESPLARRSTDPPVPTRARSAAASPTAARREHESRETIHAVRR